MNHIMLTIVETKKQIALSGFLKHFDQITFGGGRRMQQLLTWSTSPIETSSCYKLRARAVYKHKLS